MKRLLIVLLCAMALGAAAQQGVVVGRVIDARTGEYIEYANVALLKASDSTLVNGTVSEGNGSFAVTAPNGRYLLRVTFMGYDTYFHSQPLILGDGRHEVNVGKVQLKAHAKTMEAVEISAERSMVEYQLDKRVINVDKNLVTGGGTATDVLEQVPSVAVDNDGNVTLRGSTNVKVLVNGRPSELLASDLATLLEQIPASTVENVEVITNPSAKYDPEGMSGIINIKLKDKTAGALGLNGVVNLNAGAPLPFMIPKDKPQFIPTVMGNVSLNYTTEKYNLFLNMDGGIRQRGNKSHTDIEYLDNNGNPRSHYDIDQFSINPNYMGSVKVGGEYYFAVDATFSTRRVVGEGMQEQTYRDALAQAANYYRRDSETENHHQALNVKLNWLRPLDSFFGKEGWRLETGYEGRMDWPNQKADYYRSTSSTDHVYDSTSSTHFDYRQHVHAVYGTLGGNLTERLSLQGGLRGEYASIYGHDIKHPDTKPVDKTYWQLYPTLHLSYKFSEMQSMQVSYSRRVRRPHMWDLNPYMDVREGDQISFGNPNLDPEYTNAFEVSYNLGINKVNVFTSAYYRQTNHMITRYGFTWTPENVDSYAWWEPYNSQYYGYRASTSFNLHKGYNYGLEFIVDWQPFQWWKLNVSLNLYQSHIEGSELLNNQSSESFQASGKFSSFMTLPKDWTIQLSGQYWAPWLDLQTQMDPSYWVDLAVKKDVFNKRGTVNLRVSDVLRLLLPSASAGRLTTASSSVSSRRKMAETTAWFIDYGQDD